MGRVEGDRWPVGRESVGRENRPPLLPLPVLTHLV